MLLLVIGVLLPAGGAAAAELPPGFTAECPAENPDGDSYARYWVRLQ